MEWIDFQAGKQIEGTIVKDSYGAYWKVLKNITYATAQPREGQYYTRVPAPEVVVAEPLPPVEPARYIDLHPDDFKIEQTTVNGVVVERIRIKR